MKKTHVKAPTERHKVCHGLWIELPVGLAPEAVQSRIEKYLSRLGKTHFIYNPKSFNHN